MTANRPAIENLPHQFFGTDISPELFVAPGNKMRKFSLTTENKIQFMYFPTLS